MSKKRADIPITATMLQALPAVYDWMKVCDAMALALPKLRDDMVAAEHLSAAQIARAFLSIYAVKQRLDERVKEFNALFEDMKETRVPESLEVEGQTNVPLEEGWRIQTADTLYVSVVKGMREEAMAWLRETSAQSKDGGALADLITETINASTLSAAARFMLEQQSIDLPSHLFESNFVRTTSVNKIASKR